ncbi:choline-sulfatase [Klebsiella pneumoniae]|uniref:Choline-sulfatase n=1 Tax=Klebsiella pneumoniae TaxID=573 RepID=A0A447RNE5_KLEPN|nr:choline-sulfatase [Klebsiella pneumoniae]
MSLADLPPIKEYQNARAVMEGQFPDEDRRWRKLLDYYFNCIRDNDQHLEAILNELDNLQLTQIRLSSLPPTMGNSEAPTRCMVKVPRCTKSRSMCR